LQLALARSSSLGDSSRPQRHLVAILKEDKETFGFEIQTIRFPNPNDCSLEVCTCVCKIQDESPAHLSGLQTGDILASINGVNTDGFSHKQIVDLIKSSGNYLSAEYGCDPSPMRSHQRGGGGKNLILFIAALVPYQRVCSVIANPCGRSETRSPPPEHDTRSVPQLSRQPRHRDALIRGGEPGPGGGRSFGWVRMGIKKIFGQLPSTSCVQFPSFRTNEFGCCSTHADQGLFCMSSKNRVDAGCKVFFRSYFGLIRGQLCLVGSGSMSPLWEGSSCSSSFGTLPRKSRRSSVRKHLLKFIPGLHRAVEEEESRV
ncbi:Cytohesin-interacting protein, partial [Egretta garzetta]